MASLMNTITLGLWPVSRPNPNKVEIRKIFFTMSPLSGMTEDKLKKLISKLNTMDGTLPVELEGHDIEIYNDTRGCIYIYYEPKIEEDLISHINENLMCGVVESFSMSDVDKFIHFPSYFDGKRLCACDCIVDENKDCRECPAVSIRAAIGNDEVTIEFVDVEEGLLTSELKEVEDLLSPDSDDGVESGLSMWYSLCTECGNPFHVHKKPDFEHEIYSPCCGMWSLELSHCLDMGEALHICTGCNTSWHEGDGLKEDCPDCATDNWHKFLTNVPEGQVHN